LTATGVGFLLMGVIAFIVKIVHIPVTQILVGPSA
jgi:preprotein translocase subunit Sss1